MKGVACRKVGARENGSASVCAGRCTRRLERSRHRGGLGIGESRSSWPRVMTSSPAIMTKAAGTTRLAMSASSCSISSEAGACAALLNSSSDPRTAARHSGAQQAISRAPFLTHATRRAHETAAEPGRLSTLPPSETLGAAGVELLRYRPRARQVRAYEPIGGTTSTRPASRL
jgi:hypothetical protein